MGFAGMAHGLALTIRPIGVLGCSGYAITRSKLLAACIVAERKACSMCVFHGKRHALSFL